MHSESRWELTCINHKDQRVIVYDNLSKRPREYFVPHVVSAEINKHQLRVTTATNKIMIINLFNASRQFL